VELDTSHWSGDGECTRAIVERLRADARVLHVRVEDAPASRDDVSYTFVSNELFIRPAVTWQRRGMRGWGFWPSSRRIAVSRLSVDDLEALLAADPAIGAPDYRDEGMVQFLRTQRIVPAYQTRGYKLVELVRIYMAALERPV
jgi:hypothetical protein